MDKITEHPVAATEPVLDLPATRNGTTSSDALRHEARDELQPLPSSLNGAPHVLPNNQPFSSSPPQSREDVITQHHPAEQQDSYDSNASFLHSRSSSVGPLYEGSGSSQPILIANNARGMRVDRAADGFDTLPEDLARTSIASSANSPLDEGQATPIGPQPTSSSPVASTSYSVSNSSGDQARTGHDHSLPASTVGAAEHTEVLAGSTNQANNLSRQPRRSASNASSVSESGSRSARKQSTDLDKSAIPEIPSFHGATSSRRDKDRTRPSDPASSKSRDSAKSSTQNGSGAIASNGSRRQLGEWTLGKTVGAGSMGKVKLATSTVTGEKACLCDASTVLPADFVPRRLLSKSSPALHQQHLRKLNMPLNKHIQTNIARADPRMLTASTLMAPQKIPQASSKLLPPF